MENKPFVICRNLVKIYKIAELEVVALQGLDLVVNAGEIMALVGPSGAGKSTLLNIIGALDSPSAGSAHVGNWDLLQMDLQAKTQYKRDMVGFVWQQPGRNLLGYMTAEENIELPMVLAGVAQTKRRNRALELLDVVNLLDKANYKPDRLSGGQQQRIALAVALANNPPLLLGDELTGQIDTQSASEVFSALRRINDIYGTTIITVTHDPYVANIVDRLVAIRDGKTSTEVRRTLDNENGQIKEEEWVILDPAGRLQLPKPFIEYLGLTERVHVRLEPDHVSVWSGFSDSSEHIFTEPVTGEEEDMPLMVRHTHGEEIQLSHITRTFFMGAEEIHAVNDVTLTIEAGTFCALKGRSGSGKTTLLNIIAGLDEPSQGNVHIGATYLQKMNVSQRLRIRRHTIGFIYQTFGLLPFLSAEENVGVTLRLLRIPHKKRQNLIHKALSMVGLSERAKHRVYELSGGEQQRVAIARVLVKQPSIILADEPTGQLDSSTGQEILLLLRGLVDRTGLTVVVATHDAKVLKMADCVFELVDGSLVNTIEQTHNHVFAR